MLISTVIHMAGDAGGAGGEAERGQELLAESARGSRRGHRIG